MATSTERFGFTKPAGSDPASVVPLNSNTDLIELYLGRTQDMIAPMYDDTATYDVGDIVTYESNLYKCITAISTAETFDPTKWEATTAVDEGGGGGSGASAIEKTQTEYDALTPAQKTNGAIYMVSNDGETIDTPLNMSDITVFRESNTNATSSVDETVVSWDGGSQIGLNYYYTAPVDVTDVKSIKYNLTTRSCYGGGAEAQRESWRFYVGVTLNPITSFQYDTSKMLAFNEHKFSNTTYTDEQCTIDVSELSGLVYLTVLAHGWNATLSDVVTSKVGDATNKIYYMGTEYANTNGGSSGSSEAGDINYDNTTSQLTADNVQDALDEVVANADTTSEDILTLQNVQGYDAYDEAQTYAVGDYAIYNNHVYECTTAVSTAEPFDSTKWSQTSIEQIIDGVKGDVSQLNSSLASMNTVTQVTVLANVLVVYKKFNMATMRIFGTIPATNDGVTIATLPVGYRPLQTYDVTLFNTAGTKIGILRLDVDGTIKPTFGNMNSGAVRMSVPYIV